MIFRNSQRNKTDDEEQGSVLQVVVRFSGTTVKVNLDPLHFLSENVVVKEEKGDNEENSSLFTFTYYLNLWGCSSVGRAPALQAGGQGFESLHLHHRLKKPKP